MTGLLTFTADNQKLLTPLKTCNKLPSAIDPPQGNICVANKDNGEKCYNQRLPSSLYCKQHTN